MLATRFGGLAVLALSEHVIGRFQLALPLALPSLRMLIVLVERPGAGRTLNVQAMLTNPVEAAPSPPHLFSLDVDSQLDNFPVLDVPGLRRVVLRPAQYGVRAAPVSLARVHDFIASHLQLQEGVKLKYAAVSCIETIEGGDDKTQLVTTLRELVTRFSINDRQWDMNSGLCRMLRSD